MDKEVSTISTPMPLTHISVQWLLDRINQHGVNNCLFTIPTRPLRNVFGLMSYTSSFDKEESVLATICEKRYKISEGYKIELKPIDARYASKTFYLMDLVQYIESGDVWFLKKFV